jgi:preprotein translocase subunit YajC
MSKFKVGDRVAAYGGVAGTDESYNGEYGTIIAIDTDDVNDITVKMDSASWKWSFYAQQLRKLIPKESPNPKEVWINLYSSRVPSDAYSTKEAALKNVTQFYLLESAVRFVRAKDQK